MATHDEARRYLEIALANAGVDLANASRAIGRNAAYLQQYIRRGKPRWLNEQDRDTLVVLYDLEGPRLQPPVKIVRTPLGSDRVQQSEAYPPKLGKVIKDPRTLDLLDIWERIRRDDAREMALRVLRTFEDVPASATG